MRFFRELQHSEIGFGFSDAPQEQGFNFVRQADTLRNLMVEGLGYDTYAAQGGAEDQHGHRHRDQSRSTVEPLPKTRWPKSWFA